MEAPAIEIAISFRSLLSKVAGRLGFGCPEYIEMGNGGTGGYVSLKPDAEGMSYVYVGGEGLSVDDSYENAARLAVRDLMDRFGIVVKDITYARNAIAEERLFLYALKRVELQAIEAGLSGVLTMRKQIRPPAEIDVSLAIDFVPLFFEILKKLPIRCTAIEVVEKRAGKFVAWVTFAPTAKVAQSQTIISDECATVLEANENMAEKSIKYLIPLYNVRIVDANYDERQSAFREISRALMKESCLTIRERMMGGVQTSRAGEMCGEQGCVTPTGSSAKIPAQKEPPLPPKKRYLKQLGEGSNSWEFNRRDETAFFKVPPDCESEFRPNQRA